MDLDLLIWCNYIDIWLIFENLGIIGDKSNNRLMVFWSKWDFY